ncbi:MAG TPA: glycosyltransferase family 39 protein [Acidimicrobiales bacterium]|nr:glycosyltransferase family 39 protein [Acidimicrobiales bacterium]
MRPAETTIDEPLPAWTNAAVAVALAAVVAAGLVLRFWTRSDLWLDEALTVNISRLPLSQIPGALRHDGSPPLYYFLLHFWMRAFGTSDGAIRALSGVFGVVSLPLAYLAGRRLAGRTVGWTALALVATSPFAVRYSTEARMYMMIVALSLAGFLAVDAALRRPAPLRLAAAAVISGLLALSHYWALYLIATTVVLLAWIWRREGGRDPRAPAALRTLVAVVAGTVVLLAPWVRIMAFQLRHTGTPWSGRANFSAMVNSVSDFAGGASSTGRALGLLFFALAGLGLFGAAIDRVRIELDLRTRPLGRSMAWLSFGTLGLGVVTGYVARSAYTARYTAVGFAFFILLVAIGVTTLADTRIRYLVVGAAVAFGFGSSVPNVTTNRTQAARIARSLDAHAVPGDLVVYCPDQLGPGTSRLVRGHYVQITYPRAMSPARVDWVDYAKVNARSSPAAFARAAIDRAGPGHSIWLVFSPDYLAVGSRCATLEADLAALRPHSKAFVVQSGSYFEHANLDRFWPS